MDVLSLPGKAGDLRTRRCRHTLPTTAVVQKCRLQYILTRVSSTRRAECRLLCLELVFLLPWATFPPLPTALSKGHMSTYLVRKLGV